MIKRTVLLIVLLCALTACDKRQADSKQQKENIVVAKLVSSTQRFYYSGVLEPLTMQSVLSPVEGRVARLDFSYGQFIKNDQLLLTIDSNELTKNYRKSIADYLQKKSAYTNSLEKFRGSQALYKAKVLSRDSFMDSRSQYRTSELNYYQSRYTMEKVLSKAGVNPKQIEKLTLENAKTVNRLLRRQFKHIVVRSRANGVALFPIQGDSGDDNKRLKLGDSVKQGESLLTIGDLTGLSLRIQVNEVNVNRIHPGMLAVVSGSAFTNIHLKAYIAAVSSQAKNSRSATAVSQFPVLIKVPKLTKAQQKIIRVGMTAKVMLVIKKKPSILLPVNAVFEKNGQPFVTVLSKTGKRQARSVVIGFTTPMKIAIASGLQAGERVVVPNA